MAARALQVADLRRASALPAPRPIQPLRPRLRLLVQSFAFTDTWTATEVDRLTRAIGSVTPILNPPTASRPSIMPDIELGG